MKIIKKTAAIAGLAILPVISVQAAQITVLASTAVKTSVEELAPQFEKATGNKVIVTFGPTTALKEKIDEARSSTLRY